MNILFVCTGNTCRSPMAEALFKMKTDRHKAQSAGMYAIDGVPINENAVRVLQEHDIRADYHSQQMSDELLEWADLVLAMTSQHQQMLVAEYPASQQKIHLLKSYATNANGSGDDLYRTEDIHDPFGQELATYRETLSELDIYIDKLIQKIDTGDSNHGEKTSI